MAEIDTKREREAIEALAQIAREEPRIAAAVQEKFTRAVQARAEASLEAKEAATATILPIEICQEYSKVKGLIETALWLIERIPFYGRQIAAALRVLMGLMDSVCSLPS